MPVQAFDSGLEVSREYLVGVPPVPLWSETGAYSAYDPAQNIGFWMHMGRFSYEPNLWHEALIVYLPDGGRLAFKNYGVGETSLGPKGALMTFSCLEPFQRWEFRYDGPARRVSNALLFAGALAHGREERLQIELTIDSVKPIWDLASAHASGEANHDWGSSHDQQLSEVHGRIVSGEGEVSFDGAGWRDHSRGPRDIGTIAGHTILGAWFADDDCGFVTTHVRTVNGEHVRAGRLFVGAQDEPLAGDLPAVEDPRALPMSFDVVLPAPSGDQEVRVEVQQYAPITMQSPNHISIGMIDEPGSLVISESQARFIWDGRVGYGYVERSRRI
jgi:hypothetical protein